MQKRSAVLNLVHVKISGAAAVPVHPRVRHRVTDGLGRHFGQELFLGVYSGCLSQTALSEKPCWKQIALAAEAWCGSRMWCSGDRRTEQKDQGWIWCAVCSWAMASSGVVDLR